MKSITDNEIDFTLKGLDEKIKMFSQNKDKAWQIMQNPGGSFYFSTCAEYAASLELEHYATKIREQLQRCGTQTWADQNEEMAYLTYWFGEKLDMQSPAIVVYLAVIASSAFSVLLEPVESTSSAHRQSDYELKRQIAKSKMALVDTVLFTIGIQMPRQYKNYSF